MNFEHIELESLPIIYSTKILIPGITLKIQLEVANNHELLNKLNEALKDTDSNYMIGVIPKTDIGKVDDVIGTVGVVECVIQINSELNLFYIVVHGIYRFILGTTISEEPIKINHIYVINYFHTLSGDDVDNFKLKAEFDKVFIDFFKYSKLSVLKPFKNEDAKKFLSNFSLREALKFCLNNVIQMTPSVTYEVLRATSLDDLLILVIDLLKRETIKENIQNTSVVSMPFPFLVGSTNLVPSIGYSNNIESNYQSSELKELHTELINSNIPLPAYDLLLKEFDHLKGLNFNNSSYSVYINYIKYVLQLPWNKITEETLNLEKIEHELNINHYGMDKVKKRIIQFIAIKILNPKKTGPILCFIGPPGIGKSSIAESIANSLNRTFKRISLGGVRNSSDIKGHRKTFVGSMPGCIIHAISQAQTKNPVILLDEIDKMCKGPGANPSAALLEVLDPEQNNAFVDSYINIPFDLSQVMFISTANDINDVPLTLQDRLEIINLEGYSTEEKVQIAENFMIPKILKDHKMNESQIIIFNNTVYDIIKYYTYEAGVRELQRKIEEICQYVALKIVKNADKKGKNYLITPDTLMDIFGNKVHNMENILIQQSCDRIGVAIGLVWTPVGGLIQMIEASKLCIKKKNNSLVLTGLVGQTLKESVEIAFNWIQLFAKENDMNIKDFSVHIHFPLGGHIKDGPSSGVTIVCALISLFWRIPLQSMIATTGEISLNGHILPVGGIKEKILIAYNSNIRTVIIPELNLKDVNNLPKNVVESVNIIPVKYLKDVLAVVIPGGLSVLKNPTASIVPRSKI